ncbi:MAG: capA, partial [bacterium]
MFISKKTTTFFIFLLLFCFYITSNAFWQESASKSTKDKISFAAVGDIMMGTTWPEGATLPPNDAADILKEITPILSKVDIAFGNLEGPMLEGGKSSKCGSKSKNCYAFRVPTRYGNHLKDAGFDLISLANNHANDFGAYGMESSQKVLDNLGIVHSGPIGSIGSLTVNNKKVSLVAFASNGVSYNINDVETAKKVVSDTVKK